MEDYYPRLIRELNNLEMCLRGLKRNNIPELTAEEVIKRAIAENGDNLTLGWSGGECSTVVLHMALKIKPNIKVLYNNTGVEFPENVKYVYRLAKEWNLNFVEVRPDTTFWKIVKEYGFPKIRSKGFGRKRDKTNLNVDRTPMCCYLLKEKNRYAYYRENNITGDIAGLRASESRLRAIHIGKLGQIYKVRKTKDRPAMTYYQPVALWTIEDIKKYFKDNNIPFNETYRTQSRNGCWSCTAYKGWEQNLLAYNPRMLRLILHMQGIHTMDKYIASKIERKVCGET